MVATAPRPVALHRCVFDQVIVIAASTSRPGSLDPMPAEPRRLPTRALRESPPSAADHADFWHGLTQPQGSHRRWHRNRCAPGTAHDHGRARVHAARSVTERPAAGGPSRSVPPPTHGRRRGRHGGTASNPRTRIVFSPREPCCAAVDGRSARQGPGRTRMGRPVNSCQLAFTMSRTDSGGTPGNWPTIRSMSSCAARDSSSAVDSTASSPLAEVEAVTASPKRGWMLPVPPRGAPRTAGFPRS